MPTKPSPRPPISMSDGPRASVEIEIDATPERVWELVSDIELPARFSEEFIGAEWLDPPGIGSRFAGHNGIEGLGEWTTTSTVTSWTPEGEFAWAVEDPDSPAASWQFTMHSRGAATMLGFSVTLGPGESFLTHAIGARPDRESAIIASRLKQHRANMMLTLEGIKALAETPAEGSDGRRVES